MNAPRTHRPTNVAGFAFSQALRRLHTAREAVLRQLSVQDAYVIAKRSLINQLRLRSALELVHAGDEDQLPQTGSEGLSASFGGATTTAKRRRVGYRGARIST